MGNSHLVARTQIYPLQKKIIIMIMEENERTKDINQGGYSNRGMFLGIWPNYQCQPLKESFSIFLKKMILVTKLSTIDVDYKDFEGQRKQKDDKESLREET
jgi:hypothetical protein